MKAERNGTFYDENGNSVSLKEFVIRIFDEREKALAVALRNANEAILAARKAADIELDRTRARLDKLESGGAPFAHRLDEGFKEIKEDVAKLNLKSVAQEQVEALQTRAEHERKNFRRQVWAVGATAALSLVLWVANFIVKMV